MKSLIEILEEAEMYKNQPKVKLEVFEDKFLFWLDVPLNNFYWIYAEKLIYGSKLRIKQNE